MDDFDDGERYDNFRLETIDTAHSQRVDSSSVIDLRVNPRINTRIHAYMISEYGKVDGLVTNLSCSGLRFETGSELSGLFMAGNNSFADYSSEIVEISFYMPAQDAAVRQVIVQARIVYVAEGEEGGYSCGIEFNVFATGKDALEDYLHVRGVGK